MQFQVIGIMSEKLMGCKDCGTSVYCEVAEGLSLRLLILVNLIVGS